MSERKRAKLAHITTVPITLPVVNGQPAFMREHGIETIAISSPGEALETFSVSQGVRVHAVKMLRSVSPAKDLWSLFRLTRLLIRERPDIVHAHTPKGGLLGMIAGAVSRVPVRIYTIHGLPYMTASGWRRWLLMATERVSCALASRVISVSHSIREVAIRDGLCPADRIIVINQGSANGIDATQRFNPDRFDCRDRNEVRRRFGVPPDALLVLFLGRIVRDKGVEDLARAWEVIRSSMPSTWLLLAGPREERDSVSPETLSALEEDDRVILPGNVKDPAPLYAAADLLVLPTYREGFPTVLLEAAAMGLPAVATRIPGCIDAVVDGLTGTLVDTGSADQLAAAMLGYLRDAERRKAHGRSARARVVMEFVPEVIWQGVLAQYEALMQSRDLKEG